MHVPFYKFFFILAEVEYQIMFDTTEALSLNDCTKNGSLPKISVKANTILRTYETMKLGFKGILKIDFTFVAVESGMFCKTNKLTIFYIMVT